MCVCVLHKTLCGYQSRCTQHAPLSPAAALLLLYDITSKASFDNIRVSRAPSFSLPRVSQAEHFIPPADVCTASDSLPQPLLEMT